MINLKNILPYLKYIGPTGFSLYCYYKIYYKETNHTRKEWCYTHLRKEVCKRGPAKNKGNDGNYKQSYICEITFK